MKSVFISHSLKQPGRELADVLSAELEEAGYGVLRYPDYGSDIEPGFQEYTRRADLVIGLVTDENPKVFFEIGYGSGIGKRVLLVTYTDVSLPADLRSFHCIDFGTTGLQTVSEIVAQVHEMSRQQTSTPRTYTSYQDILGTFRTDPVYFETLDHKTFDRCLFDLLQDKRFEPEIPDRTECVGIDLVLKQYGDHSCTLVETKKYNKNSIISVGRVQQLFGAIAAYHADHGIIITTSSFTRSAVDFASKRRPQIELWDMEKILDMI